MDITYWDTLYKKTASKKCFSQITFTDDGITFASGGHRYHIRYENVIKIENIEGYSYK